MKPLNILFIISLGILGVLIYFVLGLFGVVGDNLQAICVTTNDPEAVIAIDTLKVGKEAVCVPGLKIGEHTVELLNNNKIKEEQRIKVYDTMVETKQILKDDPKITITLTMPGCQSWTTKPSEEECGAESD